MTTQTKKLINLSDILAFNFACKGCGTSLSISPKEYLGSRRGGVLGECPVCGRHWAQAGGSTCEPTIQKFIESLDRLCQTLEGKESSFPAGFVMSLEITHGREDAE